MTQTPGSNLAHSVQARLKNAAAEGGRPFAELLELYAVERFLHRLGRSRQRDHFVLKGAMLLRQWLGAQTRPTRDIDLLGPVDLDAAALREAIADILRTAVEDDAIAFAEDSIAVRPIRGDSAVLGLRAKFDATLGRAPALPGGRGARRCGLPSRARDHPGRTAGHADGQRARLHPVLHARGEAGSRRGPRQRQQPYEGLLRPPRVAPRAQSGRGGTRRIDPPHPRTSRHAFASDPLQAGRWRAFLDKGGLRVAGDDFVRVVAAIRNFAQPVLDAVRAHSPFDRQREPGGPWR